MLLFGEKFSYHEKGKNLVSKKILKRVVKRFYWFLLRGKGGRFCEGGRTLTDLGPAVFFQWSMGSLSVLRSGPETSSAAAEWMLKWCQQQRGIGRGVGSKFGGLVSEAQR